MDTLINKSKTLHVFFAYAFYPHLEPYSRADIISVVEEACSIATQDLCHEGLNIELRPSFILTEYGQQLATEIVTTLKTCALCVVDISDNNPNIFYELGIAQALGLGIVILKSNKTKVEFRVPSDIEGVHILMYDSISSIVGKLSKRLKELAQHRFLFGNIEDISIAKGTWSFSEYDNIEHINVIAASSATESQFRDIASSNYIYLDNLSDKDTILELSILLSKIYPSMTLRFYCSDNVPPVCLEDHLILVGGIGTAEVDNNIIAKQFFKHLGIQLIYPNENTISFAGEEYKTEISSGIISRDYGFFGRLPNPLNRKRRIFCIQGIHTFGVLGAMRCFSLHPDAQGNHRLVNAYFDSKDYFAALFPVDILQGQVIVPKINNSHFKEMER